MPQMTMSGKCEGGGGREGGNPELIAWDKNSVNTEFLEDLV